MGVGEGCCFVVPEETINLMRNLWHRSSIHAKVSWRAGLPISAEANIHSTLHTATTPESDVTYGTIDKATAGGKSAIYAALV
jgi:hypothetical protein